MSYSFAMATIAAAEAGSRLQKLPGWTLEDNAIRKQFTFDGFPTAIAFIVRLGFDAEAADHHPDILVNYKRVTLTYSTHSEGGLTEKDFAGAATASQIAAVLGGR
jgi:4a-hydroxytetrahydrobiopterin dehydratase